MSSPYINQQHPHHHHDGGISSPNTNNSNNGNNGGTIVPVGGGGGGNNNNNNGVTNSILNHNNNLILQQQSPLTNSNNNIIYKSSTNNTLFSNTPNTSSSTPSTSYMIDTSASSIPFPNHKSINLLSLSGSGNNGNNNSSGTLFQNLHQLSNSNIPFVLTSYGISNNSSNNSGNNNNNNNGNNSSGNHQHHHHSNNMNVQQMINSASASQGGNTSIYEDVPNTLSYSYENIFNLNTLFSETATKSIGEGLNVLSTSGNNAIQNLINQNNNNNSSSSTSNSNSSSSSNIPETIGNVNNSNNGGSNNPLIMVTPSSDISSPSPPNSSILTSNISSSSPNQPSPLPSPSSSSYQHRPSTSTTSTQQFYQTQSSNLPLSPSTSSSSPLDYNTSGIIQTYGVPQIMQNNSSIVNNTSVSAAITTKKLKRDYDQTLPKDEWEPYIPNGKVYPLFNSKNELTNTFGFKVKRIDKNITYSDLDSAWILYRQNRFQIECELNGSLENYNADPTNPLFINNNGAPLKVETLHFSLYVLKFSNVNTLQVLNEMTERVPIHQLGNTSGKKDGRLPVDSSPVIKGKSSWSKLQFGSATANNARINPEQPNPNQQFFRIVVVLNAVVEQQTQQSQHQFSITHQYFPLGAKISPPMIVRGQNPGRFLNHEKSSKKDFNSSPGGQSQSASTLSSPGTSGGSSGQSSSPTTSTNNLFAHQQPQQQQFAQPFAHPINNLTAANSVAITSTTTTTSSTTSSNNTLKSSSSSISSSSSSNSSSLNNETDPLNSAWLSSNNNNTTSNNNNSTNNNTNTNHILSSSPYFGGNNNNNNSNSSTTTTTSTSNNTSTTTTSGNNNGIFQFLSNTQLQQQQQQQQSNNNNNFVTINHSQIQQTGNPFSFPNQSNTNIFDVQNNNSNNSNNNNTTTTPSPWLRNPLSDEIVYTNGKVGINTNSPTQALTVNGNILVTGDLYKPSDRRIKSNIVRDSSNHWDKIDRLKIYNYDRKKMPGYDNLNASSTSSATMVKEKGFLAQELREVIPNAVSVAGEVRLQDGTTIPNLLVVNDRVLLLENIGATQQIGRTLRREHDHIIEMDKEINRVKLEGNRQQHVVLNKMQDLVSFMLSEEQSQQTSDHGDSCVYCSLLGLGPAWTMFVFGFFVPLFWLFGSFFLFSPSRVKWISGLVNFITLVIFVISTVLIVFYQPNIAAAIILPSIVFFGIVLCIVVGFFRQRTWESKKRFLRERMKLMQKDGYRQLNDHIDQFRNQYSRKSTKQSIDITPISEMEINNFNDHDVPSVSGTGTTSSATSSVFTSEVDSFKSISLSNHLKLQEIPLQKLVTDYGKKKKQQQAKKSMMGPKQRSASEIASTIMNHTNNNNNSINGSNHNLGHHRSQSSSTVTTTSTTTTTTSTTIPSIEV